MRDILITGAGGGAARMLRPILRDRFGPLVLTDREAPEDLADGETFRSADLTDPEAVQDAVSGCRAVVHLGGQSLEADWDTIDSANIQGTQTLLNAARHAGVERFVFASSNHTVGFYCRDRRLGIDARPRPDSLYGVSKVFGEALCSLYADKYGLRCLSIRIGKVTPAPINAHGLSIWVHPEDLAQLVEIGLTHPDLHNAVVWGVSRNARAWWDNQEATDLGYAPAHDAEFHRTPDLEADRFGPIGETFMGGDFAEEEFDGDPARTAGL